MKKLLSIILVVSSCALLAETNKFADLSGPMREFKLVRKALRDQLWVIAEKHAREAERTAEARDNARLAQLEALARAGRTDKIIERLDSFEDADGEQFKYWRAWALNKLQHTDEAMRILQTTDFVDEDYAVLALRLRSQIVEAQGDNTQAEHYLLRAKAIATKEANIVSVAIERAELAQRIGRLAVALGILRDVLNVKTQNVVLAKLKAAQLAYELGQTKEAQEFFMQIEAQGTNVTSQIYVQAACALAKYALQSSRRDDAITLATRALERAQDTDARIEAGCLLGFIELKDKPTRQQGRERIKQLVRSAPDAPEAREALLLLADTLLELGENQAAADEYRMFLQAYPGTDSDARVLEARAWALQRMGNTAEAVSGFMAAARMCAKTIDQARCIIKAGDAYAATNDWAHAAETYEAAVAVGATTLTDEAKFRAADAQMRTNNKARAQELFKELVASGKFVVASSLRLVEMMCDASETDNAVATCSQLLSSTNLTLSVAERADLLTARARARYRAYRFADAAKDFASAGMLDTPRAEKAAYYSAMCMYAQGRDAQAHKAMNELANVATNREVKVAAELWLAKCAFNDGDFAAARKGFGAYAQANNGTAAAKALVWSARAAMAVGDFQSCLNDVKRAAEVVGGELDAEARFVQAEALMELARFDEAVLVLDSVLALKDATSARRAAIMRADCLYALGADEARRYTEALEAYRAIAETLDIDKSTALAVAFKIARTLEKLGREAEAMDYYYVNVIDVYTAAREKGEWLGEDARSFFVRATWIVAENCEHNGNRGAAIKLLKLVAACDPLSRDEAEKRIKMLKVKGIN